MNRRAFLSSASAAFVSPIVPSILKAQVKSPRTTAKTPPAETPAKADYTLKIEPCSIEISPGVNIKTVGYNGQVPGPLLRLREDTPVKIDVMNNTANADLVHWHGLAIDFLNDGAMEEGSPMIPAGGHMRYSFTPRPSGTRWYHTHNTAGRIFPSVPIRDSSVFCWLKESRIQGTMTRRFFLRFITGNLRSCQWRRQCRRNLQTTR